MRVRKERVSSVIDLQRRLFYSGPLSFVRGSVLEGGCGLDPSRAVSEAAPRVACYLVRG
jgi:hypothetical protein